MRQIRFDQKNENGLFIYRLYYEHYKNPLFEKSWQGLFENDIYEDDTLSPYFRFGIDITLREENIVFSTFIYELLKGKNSFGIPCYYRDEAKKILKKDFDFIDWEYNLEYESYMKYPQDNGFVKGRSCISISPLPTEYEKKNKDLAGLFTIDCYADIVGLELATFGDATCEVSFFGLKAKDKNYLIEKLSIKKCPQLVDILEEDEIFIDLVIGEDLGYGVCLSVYSKTEIKDQIEKISNTLYQKCLNYEKIIEDIKTIEEFINEMKKINSC